MRCCNDAVCRWPSSWPIQNGASTLAGMPNPRAVRLKEEPRADVARYDVLLKKLTLVALVTMPLLAMTEVTHGTA